MGKVLGKRETTEDLVTDKQIDIAWGHADFGGKHSKREVISNALLKFACGYETGHTAYAICEELGLISQEYKPQLTPRGKRYLFAAFSNGLSV